jgi:transposase InsO family protein
VIAQVKEEHPEMPIERLCELMGVSRSWYYEHPSAEEKARKDVVLRDAIERIVLEFSGYGYRRVTAALRREGWSVNHKRVLRIMRQESLLCQLKVSAKGSLRADYGLGALLQEISEPHRGHRTRWTR